MYIYIYMHIHIFKIFFALLSYLVLVLSQFTTMQANSMHGPDSKTRQAPCLSQLPTMVCSTPSETGFWLTCHGRSNDAVRSASFPICRCRMWPDSWSMSVP